MRGSTLAVIAAAVFLSACGDSRPPTPSPPNGNGDTIRGTERLGWDQQAATPAELTTFRYAIYVDGARSEVADVNCAGTATASGFACSGRLPAMTSGQHTLELATFIVEGGAVTESARSAPLRVTVSPASTAPAAGVAVRRGEAPAATPPPQIRIAAASEGFDEISDMVLARDRVFVAERRGAIRVIESSGVNPRPALIAGDGIVSLTVDPAFERSRHVFVLHAGRGLDDEFVLRLVRYREVGGTFGERAVLLDNIPTTQENPLGTVRFGPDGKIYVSSSRTADDVGGGKAREGRVLRLERDGGTPADQPAFDPVHVAGQAAIEAFDFQPRTTAVWVAERDTAGARIARVPSDPVRAREGVRELEQPLARGTHVAALHFYRGRMRTLSNALLVASDAGLFAVRFDAGQPPRIGTVETLLEGRMRAIVSDSSGRLFVATPTSVLQIEPRTR